MSTLVGTKGQVTIEKEIRDALGVRPCWRAMQRLNRPAGEMHHPPWLAVRVSVADSLPGMQVVSSQESESSAGRRAR